MKTIFKSGRIAIAASVGLALVCFTNGKAQNKGQGPWVAPKDAAAKVNPIKFSDAAIKEAKKIYKETCGPCHGDKGKGDGIAAAACNPKPADHSSEVVQKESDGALFWKMSTGRNAMTPYKDVFTEEQRWKLVLYIRTLSAKK